VCPKLSQEHLYSESYGLKNEKSDKKLKKLTYEMASVSRTQPYSWLINEKYLITSTS
jgi:hypothetical protein